MSRTKTLPCPACGKRSHGNFCRHCGNALASLSCSACGASVDGRFCSECGAPTSGGTTAVSANTGRGRQGPTGGGSPDVAWWVAGGSFFALAFALGLSLVAREDPQLQAASGAGAPPPPMDLSRVTPRQAADQLFNRVMTASDNGDPATVAQFMPLALQAYESARPLDIDGLFHIALLQRTGGDYEASLASAEEILSVEPNHILGLDAAAKAALALGREDAVFGYYERILASVDVEMLRQLPEYQAHSRYFGVSRQEAVAFLGSR
ncbi:MAG TPA: zinc ribbon domain-containing protein [Longimicrobiales bacterium]|nr:zinc ribbon domain-containing protein [Longimicrobiales bacterium]